MDVSLFRNQSLAAQVKTGFKLPRESMVKQEFTAEQARDEEICFNFNHPDHNEALFHAQNTILVAEGSINEAPGEDNDAGDVAPETGMFRKHQTKTYGRFVSLDTEEADFATPTPTFLYHWETRYHDGELLQENIYYRKEADGSKVAGCYKLEEYEESVYEVVQSPTGALTVFAGVHRRGTLGSTG